MDVHPLLSRTFRRFFRPARRRPRSPLLAVLLFSSAFFASGCLQAERERTEDGEEGALSTLSQKLKKITRISFENPDTLVHRSYVSSGEAFAPLDTLNAFLADSAAVPAARQGFALLRLEDFRFASRLRGGREVSRVFQGLDGCGGDSVFRTATYFDRGFTAIEKIGGLAEEAHYIGEFPGTVNGLRPGLSVDEVMRLLGPPLKRGGRFLIYACEDEVARAYGQAEAFFDAVTLVFREGKLVGMRIRTRWQC